MHLLLFHKLISRFNPGTVIVDPVSSLISVGSSMEVKAMLVRLMDTLKMHRINCIFTSLISQSGNAGDDLTIDVISSLADNWLHLKNEVSDGKRQRSLLIVKSRGMEHYNDFIPFSISAKGLKLTSPQSYLNTNAANGK
jgi:circadian clock protein KaiC